MRPGRQNMTELSSTIVKISERESWGVCVGKRLVRAAHPPENGAVDCHGARATATLLQNWRFRSNVSPINCRGILLLCLLFDIDTCWWFLLQILKATYTYLTVVVRNN